jgi:alpha-tubulin suppressor-like RCC1 family protein
MFGATGLGLVGDSPSELGDAWPFVSLGQFAGAPARVVSVSAGTDFTCAGTSTFAIKCWGLNHMGQLGVGDKENRGDATGEMGDALPEVRWR